MYDPVIADIARLRGGELARLARHPDRLLVHELDVARTRASRRRRHRGER